MRIIQYQSPRCFPRRNNRGRYEGGKKHCNIPWIKNLFISVSLLSISISPDLYPNISFILSYYVKFNFSTSIKFIFIFRSLLKAFKLKIFDLTLLHLHHNFVIFKNNVRQRLWMMNELLKIIIWPYDNDNGF